MLRHFWWTQISTRDQKPIQGLGIVMVMVHSEMYIVATFILVQKSITEIEGVKSIFSFRFSAPC